MVGIAILHPSLSLLCIYNHLHVHKCHSGQFVHCRYNGGPEIPRKILSEGYYSKNFSIEVYPLCLCLVDARDNSERTIRISRKVPSPILSNLLCMADIYLFFYKPWYWSI